VFKKNNRPKLTDKIPHLDREQIFATNIGELLFDSLSNSEHDLLDIMNAAELSQWSNQVMNTFHALRAFGYEKDSSI
jgi:hypothetical protein